MPFWLNDVGIVSALGVGHKQTISSINKQPATTLSATDELAFNKTTFVGQVSSLPLSASKRIYSIIDLALAQITDTINELNAPSSRIAVVIGTSTASIDEGERARKRYADTKVWPQNYRYEDQELIAPADYIANAVGGTGPNYSISTACSSSAKAMISAKALLAADLADIVICGGVDSLCQLTVNGFDSLSSMADAVCKPFSADRAGINIGEGAALFIMSKCQLDKTNIAFLGGGESSDGHHISAPAPDGCGAISAMRAALYDAKLAPRDIDYINAHGTATIQNDAMESLAINKLFGDNVPVSSSKHLTGHTLGAAGGIEAAICWLSLRNESSLILPYNCVERDETLADVSLLSTAQHLPLRYCLSNSFAFGGNNASVILGKI